MKKQVIVTLILASIVALISYSELKAESANTTTENHQVVVMNDFSMESAKDDKTCTDTCTKKKDCCKKDKKKECSDKK